MEEKILIKSEKSKKISLFAFLPSVILFLIGLFLMELATQVFSRSHQYDFEWALCGDLSVFFYIISAISFLIGLIFAIGWSKSDFTVTNTRVFGVASFGKRVDLPLDSISAVGTSSMLGIDVGTSSGKIKFKFIQNNKEIHKVIGDLLINRQNKSTETIIKQEVHQSNADELKKYKDLLDSGVITQEEFDEKKKQLLGL